MFILKPPGLTKEGAAKALLAGENARKLSGERSFAKAQQGHSASVMLYSAKQKSRRIGSGLSPWTEVSSTHQSRFWELYGRYIQSIEPHLAVKRSGMPTSAS